MRDNCGNWIKKLKDFTYRIVFVPETIGSIAYLSKNYKSMKKVWRLQHLLYWR